MIHSAPFNTLTEIRGKDAGEFLRMILVWLGMVYCLWHRSLSILGSRSNRFISNHVDPDLK